MSIRDEIADIVDDTQEQERERADHAIKQWDSAEVNVEELATELARARECIEKVRTLVDNPKDAHYPILIRGDVHDILAAYDKGSSDV